MSSYVKAAQILSSRHGHLRHSSGSSPPKLDGHAQTRDGGRDWCVHTAHTPTYCTYMYPATYAYTVARSQRAEMCTPISARSSSAALVLVRRRATRPNTVASLGGGDKVTHEGVHLVGEANVQVVLALWQDVQLGVAVAGDVGAEPLRVLRQADRVLRAVQH